ncbi:MAG: hypothetical protein L0219_22590 [Phycisphaerales bacterium]|nr:hypothetical protein [Phycisphaerales bacterium]
MSMPRPDASKDRRYAGRRGDGPRRVRNGIKLRGVLDVDLGSSGDDRPGVEEALPRGSANGAGQRLAPYSVARRWLRYVRQAIEPANVAVGLEYGRSGQTISLEVQPGLIEAQVQGRAPRPYQVRWRLWALSDEQWDRLIDAMANEAVYAARLLAGEWPSALEELMATLGIAIVPADDAPTGIECTCADRSASGTCKHAATVGLLLAERLAEHPLLVFTLLGRPEEWVIERLRQARTIQSRGLASAHGEAMIRGSQHEPPPLEDCLEDFWHSPPHSKDLSELEHAAPPHHAPHALLRRMGPSPMNARFPMVGLLASVYDTVAEAARAMRDRVEREPVTEQESLGAAAASEDSAEGEAGAKAKGDQGP